MTVCEFLPTSHRGKAAKLTWTEEEEMELQRVYEELRDAEPDPGERPLL